MPFCSGCGSELGSEVGFCPKCGKPVSSAPPVMSVSPSPGGAPAATAVAGSGLDENIAALLSYVLGWLTGLIFVLIDKRPFVRFHAMQSLITFGGLHIINLVMVFGGIFGGLAGGWMMMGGIAWLFYVLICLTAVVCWVLCMIKAYQHERFKLPVVGSIAEGFAK